MDFVSPLPEQLEPISRLQSLLVSISKDNIHCVLYWIKNSVFFSDETKIQDLAREILSIPSIRPFSIESISDLCARLCIHSENFKEILLHEILNEKKECSSCHHTLRRLFKKGVYDHAQILEIVSKQQYLCFVIYFAQYISDISMIKRGIFKQFYDCSVSYELLNQDNWKILNDYQEYGWDSNSIVFKIKYDEYVELQRLSSCPGFDLNQKVTKSSFETLRIVGKPSLIEYAAAFGSLRSFKFLLLSGAILNESINFCAVGGGNLDIVHICYEKGLLKSNNISSSISYRQSNILKWLSENGFAEDICPSYCLEANNISAAYMYLKNEDDHQLSLALDTSIRCGYECFASYLLSIGTDSNIMSRF